MTRVGFVAIGRPTFDVAAATSLAGEAWETARSMFDVVGGPEPNLDHDAARRAGESLGPIDALVLAQATFTDSGLPAAVAAAVPDTPVVLWGFPEKRTGGRLRLNSLCGINLAAFRFVAQGLAFRWLYEHPVTEDGSNALRHAVSAPGPVAPLPTGPLTDLFDGAIRSLAGRTIGLIGDHPNGFEPCGFTDADLRLSGGVAVERVELLRLFEAARSAEPSRHPLIDRMEGIGLLDDLAVEQARRLHRGLDALRTGHGWDAIATRCWPECFDEWGSAACTAQSLMSDSGVPATCEADVLGAATALALQEMTGGPALVADLVDVDRADGTVAFWHCGIAPPSMAHPDEPITAMGHPNRGLPLINQFRLRPGRIVVGRISRTGAVWHTTGEVLDRPRPYHGTSAVVRLDVPPEDFLESVMSNGLEHHYGMAYL